MLDLSLEKAVGGWGGGESMGHGAPEDKVSAPKKLHLLCSLHRVDLSDISIYSHPRVATK